MLLKPKGEQKGLLARFFAAFNRMFDSFTNKYAKVAGFAARKLVFSVVILLLICVVAGLLGKKVNTGFVPEEDEGYYLMSIQLPNAASLSRTEAVTRKVQALLSNIPSGNRNSSEWL